MLYRLSGIGLGASAVLALFFYTKVAEQDRLLGELIETALHSRPHETTEAKVLALSREIYRRTNRGLEEDDLDWYSRAETTSPFNMASGTSLSYGAFGLKSHSVYGPCGTMTRTLLNALWKAGIPARKLVLLDNEEGWGGGHTMLEFFDGGRWLVIAPSDNSFVWRKANGEVATAAEINSDDEVFRQIYRQEPDYPYRFDNYRNIRWDKFPQSTFRWIKLFIGEENFEKAETPRLYDLPRTLFLLSSLTLTALFGALALILRSKLRPLTPNVCPAMCHGHTSKSTWLPKRI